MAKTVLKTAATSEPVTLADVRLHLRIADADHEEDAWLAQRIVAGRAAVEDYCGIKLVTQTWTEYFDRVDYPLRLKHSPAISIASVTYIDSDGTTQTLAATVYELGVEDGRGIVRLKYDQSWPTDVRTHPDSVIVEYSCGYGAASAVPQRIKQAISLYCSHFYEFREGEHPLPNAFYDLLGPYMLRGLA